MAVKSVANKRIRLQKSNPNSNRQWRIIRPVKGGQVEYLQPKPLMPLGIISATLEDPLKDFSEQTGAAFG